MKWTHFPFLKLPSELRRYICQLTIRRPNPNIVRIYCRHEGGGLDGYIWRVHDKKDGPKQANIAALSEVSRSIYEEAVQIIYEESHFWFPHVGVLQNFLLLIESLVSFLRALTLPWIRRCFDNTDIKTIFRDVGPREEAENTHC